MTEPQRERESHGGFLAFWTTLPGILTGIAAVITALVGLISLWHATSTNSGNQPITQAAESPPSQTPAASGQETATATTKTAARASGVLARGRVDLTRGDNADLEQGVIAMTANADVIFGPESTPNLFATANAFLAPSQQRPSKSVCRAALTHRRDPFEVLPTLDTKWICVSTVEGHIAAVTVIRTPGVGNAHLTLGYTVWR